MERSVAQVAAPWRSMLSGLVRASDCNFWIFSDNPEADITVREASVIFWNKTFV